MEVPSSEVFSDLYSGQIDKLWSHERDKLKPYLPFICSIALSPSPSIPNEPEGDQESVLIQNNKETLHSLLCDIEETNIIKNYFKLDFTLLRGDALKEQGLLRKLGSDEEKPREREEEEEERPAIVFERGNEEKRFRLLLREILRIMSHLESSFGLEASDLFECQVWLNEISYILCIAVKELNDILPLVKVCEALLRVKNGPYLICRLLANEPHHYKKIVTSLVTKGETLDEISLAGRLRSQTLRGLVTLIPSHSSYVQWLAYTNQKLPTLMIFIALDIEAGELVGNVKGGGVLSLMSDIVIHGSKEKKTWFSQYMKLMQQKYRRHHSSAVTALRKYLMKKLLHFINLTSKSVPSSDVPLSMEVDVNNEGLMEEEGGEEGMDTATLELVDQMEIEISEIEDGEGTERGGGREEGPEKVEGGTTESMETIQALDSKRTHNSSFSFEQIDFPVISLSRQFSDESILQLTQLIHVCCALKTQANMYLTNEESAALLHLITCTCPPFSSAGVQFIEVALSILLTCPFLINSEDGEESVLRWITWLLENIQEFEKAIPGERVYGEMLLLVVIHLQEKQLKEIETLISSVLGMTLQNSLGSGHFSTLKDIFLKVFKGDVVCSHAVSVPPTSSLSGHMTGYLPVHCILQLMRSKAFRKHGVFVKDWIYKQLVTTVEPVHPDLPSLIEEYVQAMLVSPLSASSHAKSRRAPIVQIPFSAEEVLSVFRFDDASSEYSMCSKILILYYVLYYQETYLSNLKSLLVSSRSDAPKAYSPSVLLQLPVKRLLQYATNNQEAFLTVYPSLLRMIVTQFPQLYLPEDWIRQDDINQSSLSSGSRLRLSSKKVTPEVAATLLSTLNTNPSDAMLVLTFLSSLSVTSLVPFSSSLVSSLHLLLEDGVSKRVQQLFSSLWMKLNSVIPRRLWVETVNALRSDDQRTHPPCTHQTILEDPLIVLQCDLRVFRCLCVFEILLRVLAAYTSASRVWLLEHSHKLNCMSQASNDPSVYHLSSQEREELRVALTAAQESGIIQLLLEICLPNDKDREEASVLGPQLTVLREIQCLVCSYLHQVFISEPSMVKLIHFQGYPSQLLPLLVSGVPSMHIATDFLPELLAQPQLEKQVFAIQLAAHVIHQYPLPESVGLVKDSIFKKLHRFIDEVPSKRQHGIFFPLLPAMVLLCQTFPPLTVEAVDFLLHLCRVCLVNSLPGYNGDAVLPLDTKTVLHTSCNPQQLNTTPFNNDAKEFRSNKMTSPLFLLEERLEYLRNLSLVEGARWAFDEIYKTVLMKVSCKT